MATENATLVRARVPGITTADPVHSAQVRTGTHPPEQRAPGSWVGARRGGLGRSPTPALPAPFRQLLRRNPFFHCLTSHRAREDVISKLLEPTAHLCEGSVLGWEGPSSPVSFQHQAGVLRSARLTPAPGVSAGPQAGAQPCEVPSLRHQPQAPGTTCAPGRRATGSPPPQRP